MIRILSWKPTGELQTDVKLSELRDILLDSDRLVWMDLYESTYEESYRVMTEIFNFHPLAIEDSLEETHVPKIDDWGDYLYLVIQVIDSKMHPEEDIKTKEVDIFIGLNFLVTYHIDPSTTIDNVWDRLQRDRRYLERGAIQVLYLVLDETATDFISNTEQLALQVNDLEDQLFDNPDPSLLEVIFSLKRGILHLRNSIGPQREVLNKLARGDFLILGEDSKVYFRDVYDHFMRLFDIIENLRDLTSNTLEIYLSVVNNRMNGIMKTLTIITTLFMPISFLASFFGMNFFKPVIDLQNWTGAQVFSVVLFATILFPIGLLFYFLRKGWMR